MFSLNNVLCSTCTSASGTSAAAQFGLPHPNGMDMFAWTTRLCSVFFDCEGPGVVRPQIVEGLEGPVGSSVNLGFDSDSTVALRSAVAAAVQRRERK